MTPVLDTERPSPNFRTEIQDDSTSTSKQSLLGIHGASPRRFMLKVDLAVGVRTVSVHGYDTGTGIPAMQSRIHAVSRYGYNTLWMLGRVIHAPLHYHKGHKDRLG